MSQITKRGTGGGGSDITLNANNGSPLVGTSFNIFGAEFGTGPTPVNSTYTDLGNFFIENRAWTTPYVVDSNVTSGERGTFSTIQAAVDQAVADGYTRVGNGLIAVIEVRSDNQIGNIDIPENALIHIHGQTPEGSPDNNFFGSFIGGVITFGASSFVVLENLVLQTGGGDIFSLPNNNSGCIMHQCYCLDGISVLGDATFFAAQECTFTGVTLNSPTSSLNSPTIFTDCSFLTTMPMTLNSYARFSECIIPSIVLSDNAYFEIYNCFNISGGDVISGTTTGTCVADGFYGRSLGAPAFLFNFTGSLRYSNVSVRGGGHLFGPNVTLIKSLEPEGNYLQSLGVSSAHVITLGEHCIDVDSSGGPLTISLPADAHPDQEFIIIDSSQSAMTNPITVDVDGGGTINQNSDYIIQSNGGSVCVKALSSAGDFEIVWVSKPFGPPQFLARKEFSSANVTGNGTPYTVPFNLEIFDLWGNWDSNTTFTAPVTGLYQFNVCVTLTNLLAAHNAGALYLITSNRDYVLYECNVGAIRNNTGTLTICGSVIADMDVGDTAQIILTVSGSTNTVMVIGSSSSTYFSGNLINPLF